MFHAEDDLQQLVRLFNSSPQAYQKMIALAEVYLVDEKDKLNKMALGSLLRPDESPAALVQYGRVEMLEELLRVAKHYLK